MTLASGRKKRKTSVKAKKTLPKVKLPNNPFQTEILDLVSKQRTKAKKIEVLQEYRNDALVSLLIWNFDDIAFSALPEGPLPYKPNGGVILNAAMHHRGSAPNYFAPIERVSVAWTYHDFFYGYASNDRGFWKLVRSNNDWGTRHGFSQNE